MVIQISEKKRSEFELLAERLHVIKIKKRCNMKILRIMFVLLIVLAVTGFSVFALTEDKEANKKEIAVLI